MIAEQLRSLAVPIDGLVFDPANARKHGEKNLDAIKSSLSMFGQRKPIVVQRAGMVVRAGNGTLAAAKALGWNEIAAVVIDDDNATASQFAIADNRSAELAEWDEETLALLLDGWDKETREAVGFDDADMQAVMAELEPSEIVEYEVPEPPVEPITKVGDLWLLGEHRVLCGDSMKAEDVARLMGGEKAGLCFTSPPYGQQRDYTEEGKAKVADWDGLMRGVFANLPMAGAGQVLVNLGLIHRDGEWLPYWDGWIEWMRSQGWRRFGWYVWDKVAALPGDHAGRLAPRHEFVFHFNKQTVPALKVVPCDTAGETIKGPAPRGRDGLRKPMHGDGGIRNSHRVRDSVCTVAKASSGGVHPAVMPVGLATSFVESWPGSVFEPFCGSGTTLVAADQLGRKCYGMEISPQYCDVIVARWEKLTGKKAVLANG